MKTWLSLIILLLSAGIASVTHGATFRSEDQAVIDKSEVIEDDLYVFGGNVLVEGTVKGDLFVLGGNVRITGKVGHSLMVAGGNVEMDGEVGWTVRAVGGSYRMKGTVGHDLIISGGQVEAERESQVEGDVIVAAGQVRLGGDVARDVEGGGGDFIIGGVVGRNVNVEADQIKLLSEAHIKGDFTYKSKHDANIRDGAKVDGKITKKSKPIRKPPDHPRRGGGLWKWMLFFWQLLSALAVAMLFLAVAPRFSQQVSDTVAQRPWMSMGVGLVLLCMVPIVCLFVFVTIVGIPLSLMAGLLYGVALYLSPMFIGLLIGQFILSLGKREGERPSPFLSLLLGFLLLTLVEQVPFLGWLVCFLSMITGFGALVLTAWRRPSPPVGLAVNAKVP